jgi:hypothetical protein
MPLKCKDCGAIFPIAGRISTEKRAAGFLPDTVRTIVEKPCCPFCESINIEEVKPQ